MEKYMAAARTVSRIAVYGEPYEKKPGLIGKMMIKSVQDDGHVSGNVLPFSIRGSLEAVYHAPVEADYVFQFRISNRRGREPGVDPVRNGSGQPAARGAAGRSADAGPGRGGRGRGGRAPLTDEERKARLEASKNAVPPAELNIDVDEHQVLKDMVLGEEAF